MCWLLERSRVLVCTVQDAIDIPEAADCTIEAVVCPLPWVQVRDKEQLAALRKRTELAIEELRLEALAGCAAQHRLRRCWAADKLQAVHAWLRTNLAWLPVQLPMVLALVAYARSEALWLFQHLSHSAAASDLEAAVLLAAIEDVRALLVSVHQTAAVCCCWRSAPLPSDSPAKCITVVWHAPNQGLGQRHVPVWQSVVLTSVHWATHCTVSGVAACKLWPMLPSVCLPVDTHCVHQSARPPHGAIPRGS
jgi:hypothetical protein